MRIPAFLALLSLFAAQGPAAHAQSLADLAKKEEDRRKAVQGSGKAYTNRDLRLPPASPPDAPVQGAADRTSAADPPADAAPMDSTSATVAAEGQSSKDATAAKKGDEGESKDEAYWRAGLQRLSEHKDQDELLAEAVQTRINVLTADFAGRDDPAQRDKIGVDREKALSELDRLKKAVAGDIEAIAAFEEEARRAGVPPGWLR